MDPVLMEDPDVLARYETVIGLEIHIQLLTQSKVFATEAFSFGGNPNQYISPITLAHPGALPSINQQCIQHAITLGVATHCQIQQKTWFARKNYFYPDLPKGYQISQDKYPIAHEGYLDLRLPKGRYKRVGIERIHIEEDAGKSIHDQHEGASLIDLNRSGVGLVELVTHPDLRSAEEAALFVSDVRTLVRYLEICDGNMEEGSLRCDVNVSVMPKGSSTFGTRVEVKNINSITFVQKAVHHEMRRQIARIESGKPIQRQTRTWNPAEQCTQPMRDKETADDYRYFPEPDLLPVQISQEMLENTRKSLPLLPYDLLKRYTEKGKIPENEAKALISEKKLVYYFEDLLKTHPSYRTGANWLLGPVKTFLNEHQIPIDQFPIETARLGALIDLVAQGKVSHTAAKDQLFPALIQHPDTSPMKLAQEMNLILESKREELEKQMEELMAQYPEEVKRYQGGKKGLIGFFVGHLMRTNKGKADPKEVNSVVRQKLQN